MTDMIFILKISLKGLEPEIWRSIEVPAYITLDRLHDLIQIVMGWEDTHSHQFESNQQIFLDTSGNVNYGKEEGYVQVRELISSESKKLTYVYDLDDHWEHEILLTNHYLDDSWEDEEYDEGYQFQPVCLDGKGTCPPESVGGIAGYLNFCKIMKNQSHKEYQNQLKWYQEMSWKKKFKEDDFNVDIVNYQIARYMRWSRDRCTEWI